LQPAYRKLFEYNGEEFPRSELLSKTVLSLPMYPELQEEEIVYICENIHSFFDQI